MYDLSDEMMKPKLISRPRICVCCGERIARRSVNPNVCLPCYAFAGHVQDNPSTIMPIVDSSLMKTKLSGRPRWKLSLNKRK